VNVTGRNIFEKRWTDEFKKELIDSRVNPVRTMVRSMIITNNLVTIYFGRWMRSQKRKRKANAT
jgi:NAD dependent epimerase/dehydratase family enzyme